MLRQAHSDLVLLVNLIKVLIPDPLHPVLQSLPNKRQALIIRQTFQPRRRQIIKGTRFSRGLLHFLRTRQSNRLIKLQPPVEWLKGSRMFSCNEKVMDNLGKYVAVFDGLASASAYEYA